jgi:hypothetical protein
MQAIDAPVNDPGTRPTLTVTTTMADTDTIVPPAEDVATNGEAAQPQSPERRRSGRISALPKPPVDEKKPAARGGKRKAAEDGEEGGGKKVCIIYFFYILCA